LFLDLWRILAGRILATNQHRVEKRPGDEFFETKTVYSSNFIVRYNRHWQLVPVGRRKQAKEKRKKSMNNRINSVINHRDSIPSLLQQLSDVVKQQSLWDVSQWQVR